MPFTAVPAAEASKLIDSFKAKKDEHTKLNKGTNKLLKAGEIKKLDKEIKELGTKIDQKMATDLKKVRTQFEEHATNIQNAMIQCVQYLGTAEKAAKAGEAGGAFEKEQAKASASRAIDEINALIETSKTQDADYGKAWFEYRGYNPVANGLDAAYAKAASDLKSGLMNDGKGVTAKIKSMASIKEKAEAVLARVDNIAKRGALDIEDARKKAKGLADGAEKILDAMNNTKGNNLNVLSSSSAAIAGQVAQPKPETPRVVRDFMTNLVSADKFLRERIAAIDLLVAQVKTAFDADDLKDKTVATEISKLNDTAKKAKEDYKAKVPAMKEAITVGAKFVAEKK